MGYSCNKVIGFHEERDPTAETVADIVAALKSLNGEAAEAFVQLYLGNMLKDQKDENP
ncbi:MAG: hypothetical protein ACFCVD_24645 [Nodosilinea sp.]